MLAGNEWVIALYRKIGRRDKLSRTVDSGRVSGRSTSDPAEVGPDAIAVERRVRGSAAVEVNRPGDLT